MLERLHDATAPPEVTVDLNHPTTPLTIGDVAALTGLSAHSLRFYEREGLLVNPVTRDSAGRRMYSGDDVSWLRQVILKLKASGMPLRDIRLYTDLVRAGSGSDHNLAERLELMKQHRDRLTEQLAELRSCLELVDYKIGIYGDALDGAPSDALE